MDDPLKLIFDGVSSSLFIFSPKKVLSALSFVSVLIVTNNKRGNSPFFVGRLFREGRLGGYTIFSHITSQLVFSFTATAGRKGSIDDESGVREFLSNRMVIRTDRCLNFKKV